MVNIINRANLTDKELSRMKGFITESKTGCWVWEGKKDKDGYGIFYLRRKSRRAHRVVWWATNNDVIGKDFVLDHVCRNRSCVNPLHLRKVTWSVNSKENSLNVSSINRAKKTCKQGHPFDKSYTLKKTGKTQRYCSICERTKSRELARKWAKNPLLPGV